MQGPGEKWLLTLHEIGESVEDAELLWSGHDELIAKATDVLRQAGDLNSIANRLLEEAAEADDPKMTKAITQRRHLLDILSKFHGPPSC